MSSFYPDNPSPDNNNTKMDFAILANNDKISDEIEMVSDDVKPSTADEPLHSHHRDKDSSSPEYQRKPSPIHQYARRSPSPLIHQTSSSIYNSIDDIRIKARALYELHRLNPTIAKSYNSRSHMDDIRFEIEKIKSIRNIETSLDSAHEALIMGSKFVEFLSGFTKPGTIWDFRGWSESVLTEVVSGKHDDLILEFIEKYSSSINIPVEIRVVMAIGMSMMMHKMLNMVVPATFVDSFNQFASSQPPRTENQNMPQYSNNSTHVDPNRNNNVKTYKDPSINIDDIVESIKRNQNIEQRPLSTSPNNNRILTRSPQLAKIMEEMNRSPSVSSIHSNEELNLQPLNTVEPYANLHENEDEEVSNITKRKKASKAPVKKRKEYKRKSKKAKEDENTLSIDL